MSVDPSITARAKEIAAAAIEGRYGSMDDDMGYGYGYSPETMAYGGKGTDKVMAIIKSKKFMIIGGITAALVVAAVAGGIYWKKRKQQTPSA